MKLRWIIVALAALLVAACNGEKDGAMPLPLELTGSEIGHYCSMIVDQHTGPKAQLFVSDREAPYWFSSVRDALAFTMLPEEPRNIVAVYVNDMGQASWDAPEEGTWIDAETAHYVIESSRRGGMGAREAVPFSDQAAAATFMQAYGGRMVAYADVPRDYVLSSDDIAQVMQHSGDAMTDGEGGHDDGHQ